jgi:hypothetical protein
MTLVLPLLIWVIENFGPVLSLFLPRALNTLTFHVAEISISQLPRDERCLYVESLCLW